eukprot:UN08621
MRYIWQQASDDDIETMFYVSEIIHPLFPEGIEVFTNRMEFYKEGVYLLRDTQYDPNVDAQRDLFNRPEGLERPNQYDPTIVGYCI